ncbi:MAG: hypothetical protein KAI24_00170, partial [Planctomycetes bacterium]|nr:hypothetical protein [Planctomycetota bacterium]
MLAIWLPESPGWDDMVEQLMTTAVDSPQWTVVGPSSSDQLDELKKAIRWLPESGQQDDPSCRQVRLFSPWATTPEAIELLSEALCTQSFVPSDASLADALIPELGARGVSTSDEVILVLERDSEYARRWHSHISERWQDPTTNLHVYYYSRGIDGERSNRSRAAKDADQAARREQTIEAPCGLATTDYFRRLRNRILARELHGNVKAVGIFGDDIHDKLLVLQALRPALPSAQFFCSDLDAYYLNPDERPHTRNLLVASSHGLVPAGRNDIAPFRNNYQTSSFHAFHAALAPESLATAPVWRPCGHVFEIGIDTAVDLADSRDGTSWRWTGAAILIALALGWFTHVMIGEADDAEHVDLLRPLQRWLTTLLTAIAVLLWISIGLSDEPISWTKGISIWPTTVFRLLACCLATAFLLKLLLETEKSLRALPGAPQPTLLMEVLTWARLRSADDGHANADPAEDTKMIAWHALWFASFALVVFALVTLLWGWQRPPARCALALSWDIGLKAASLLMMLWLVVLVLQFARLQAARCEFERDRVRDLVDAGRMGATLDELATAGGKGIYGPFLVILVLSLGRLDLFDRWTWPTPLIMLLVTSTLAIVIAHVFLHRSAGKLKSDATAHIRQQ